MTPLFVLLALLSERALGYPQALVARIGHPVIWIGWLIGRAERRLNRPETSENHRVLAGLFAMTVILGLVMALAMVFTALMDALPLGWLIEIALASSFLAQKGLRDAVAAVARALEGEGVAAGRAAVAQIVGRDTAQLDDAEISRAAIETLAENTSDGVIAPLLALMAFGLPGLAVYKAINTADSMIGHRSERYRAFGRSAAKIDDAVNFIPARATAALFALAARTLPGADARAAMAAAQRDAPAHASPNAGWPEAAMAGALGFGLGGPRAYGGTTLDLPAMGDGRRALDARDIGKALALYDRALLLVWGALAALALGLQLF